MTDGTEYDSERQRDLQMFYPDMQSDVGVRKSSLLGPEMHGDFKKQWDFFVDEDDEESDFLKRSGGTMNGDIDMASSSIVNLADGQTALDAVNKQQVDKAIASQAATVIVQHEKLKSECKDFTKGEVSKLKKLVDENKKKINSTKAELVKQANESLNTLKKQLTDLMETVVKELETSINAEVKTEDAKILLQVETIKTDLGATIIQLRENVNKVQSLQTTSNSSADSLTALSIAFDLMKIDLAKAQAKLLKINCDDACINSIKQNVAKMITDSKLRETTETTSAIENRHRLLHNTMTLNEANMYDATGHRIINVGDPVLDEDAVNKSYTKQFLGSTSDGVRFNARNKCVGEVAYPVFDKDATNKMFVEDHVKKNVDPVKDRFKACAVLQPEYAKQVGYNYRPIPFHPQHSGNGEVDFDNHILRNIAFPLRDSDAVNLQCLKTFIDIERKPFIFIRAPENLVFNSDDIELRPTPDHHIAKLSGTITFKAPSEDGQHYIGKFNITFITAPYIVSAWLLPAQSGSQFNFKQDKLDKFQNAIIILNTDGGLYLHCDVAPHYRISLNHLVPLK